jgi:DNA-binding NarL/FixJ family response regulator
MTTRRPPLGVFIADDSDVIRTRLAELLAGVPDIVVVGQAGDVPSAKAGIAQTRPDIAILDIRMPGGSGIDVLREIKRDRAAKPCVIMYTNYGLPQYRKACAAAGADYFFDKSAESQQLAETIRTIAAGA